MRYLAQCEELSYQFIDLIAEALGLEKDALRVFFDPVMQHRAKARAAYLNGAPSGRILSNGFIGGPVSGDQ